MFAAAAGAIGAVVRQVFLSRNGRDQVQAGIRKDAYQTAIDRLETQLTRHEANAKEQEKTIARLHELHADCRSEGAELRAAIHILYDSLRRQYRTMKTAGLNPDELPELPQMLDRHDARSEAEFLARTSSQATTLLKEADSRITEATPRGRTNEKGHPDC